MEKAQIEKAQIEKPIGLRERNKAEKFFRIKASARQLFDKKGYDETTTKEIADAANVAAGTIFLYAKTKDEILYLIFEEDLTRIRDSAFASVPANATLTDSFSAVFSAFFEYYAESPELARAFIRRFVFIDRAISERYMMFQAETFEKLAQFVLRAQERGEIRDDIDPLVVVSNYWAVYCASLVFFLQLEKPKVQSGLSHMDQSLGLLQAGLGPLSAR